MTDRRDDERERSDREERRQREGSGNAGPMRSRKRGAATIRAS
jgi:hypothetical protein